MAQVSEHAPGGRGARRARLTLAQALFAALAAATLLMGALLVVFAEGSRASILQSSEALREAAARHVERMVQRELGLAQGTVEDMERRFRYRVVDADDLVAIEAALFGEMLDRPRLAEATFTRATRIGFDGDGYSRLAPERWQVSVVRAGGGAARIETRRTRREGERFVTEVRSRGPDAPLLGAPMRAAGDAPDPTDHATFATTARQRNRGTALWSDLHYAAVDAGLSPSARRVVVTVQKAVEDAAGNLLGVVRVGLLTSELDAIVAQRVNENDPADPHRVLLCDERGRLITRLAPSDPVVEDGDDLRVRAAAPPADVTAALASPLLGTLSSASPEASFALTAGGRRHLVTFRALEDTQGWNVAIIVPEEHYTGALSRARARSLGVYAVVSAILIAGGVLALRALRRGLDVVVASTMRMRRFDFAPSGGAMTPFRDIDEVAESLERAKTVVRAMGKYIPLDLVRRLYDDNREPVLGGELCEVTIMFTDIEGFTTLSEKLSPDALAHKLGLYLETMTVAIQRAQGTIDKYVGDAVMALWNVPSPVPDHSRAACEAALACVEANAALYASEAWRGLPALVTRFGIHVDRVMVGHFGAPTRLSYTALGDGVNLAARLEPLCKQYGVILMASEAVVEQAGDAFAFRRLDRVAVKGKSRGIVVYELLGRRGAPGLPVEVARVYEEALDAYFARRFDEAMALLEPQRDDPPSAVLYARCARLREAPPPDGWDGVYVATSK
jgi:adenylate cyclase